MTNYSQTLMAASGNSPRTQWTRASALFFFFLNLFPPAMEMLTSRTMSLRVGEAVCWKDPWGWGSVGKNHHTGPRRWLATLSQLVRWISWKDSCGSILPVWVTQELPRFLFILFVFNQRWKGTLFFLFGEGNCSAPSDHLQFPAWRSMAPLYSVHGTWSHSFCASWRSCFWGTYHNANWVPTPGEEVFKSD